MATDHFLYFYTFQHMQTNNNDSQSKNNISKKAGMNLDSIRMEQEKKTGQKEDTTPAGTGHDKKPA